MALASTVPESDKKVWYCTTHSINLIVPRFWNSFVTDRNFYHINFSIFKCFLSLLFSQEYVNTQYYEVIFFSIEYVLSNTKLIGLGTVWYTTRETGKPHFSWPSLALSKSIKYHKHPDNLGHFPKPFKPPYQYRYTVSIYVLNTKVLDNF